MSAPTRTRSALWQQAAEIRRSWLDLGLSTRPADRPLAEQAIAEIYARHRRPRPRFVWVPSPRAALPHLTGLPDHAALQAWVTSSRPLLTGEIAAGLSYLRSSLAEDYAEPVRAVPVRKKKPAEQWPELTAEAGLEAGLPFQEILRQGVRQALLTSLSQVYAPVRRAAGTPVGWYGNQDVSWIAHMDVLLRLGLVPGRSGRRLFEAWTAVSRAAGWWWAGEDRCVLSERPVALKLEPLPGGKHEEVRLSPGAAVSYEDGWSVSV